MPYAELRAVPAMDGDGPTFEVFSEPWRAARFSGPTDSNWDCFVAGESSASYHWRGGPDILCDLADAVAEGRITLAQAASDRRVSWWFRYIEENCPYELDDEGDTASLTPEDVCRRLLDAVRAGSIDIDSYDSKQSYYFFEWTNYVSDAANALDLPPWARRSSFEGGGPGSGYEGWLVILEPGKTLEDLERWLLGQQPRSPPRRRPRRRSRSRR